MELTPEQIEAIQAENETLRATNAELVAKSGNRKSKITEHEATIADLQSKLTTATNVITELTVNGPVKAMAESISTAPELWLQEFNKTYRVEMQNGKLTVVNVSDGVAIDAAFERQSLINLLTDEKHPQARTFRAITVVSKASGAAASVTPRRTSTETKPAIKFGLR